MDAADEENKLDDDEGLKGVAAIQAQIWWQHYPQGLSRLILAFILLDCKSYAETWDRERWRSHLPAMIDCIEDSSETECDVISRMHCNKTLD
jgi:hypothetical protein